MTVLGYHTAHELSDLLAAKHHDVDAMAQSAARANRSAPGWPAWSADYAAFRSEWDPVAADADAFVRDAKTSFLGWDSPTDDQHWNAVLAAIAPIDDLARRWTFGAYVDNGPTPQPSAPDSDLNTLNTINTIPLVSGTLPSPFASSSFRLIAGGAVLGAVALLMFKRLL